jgi:ClpP class serine protease
MNLYEDFVGAVAEHRGLPEERVREIAEGRVWIGGDAVERGLCDEVGSLTDALGAARELAGLSPEEEITIEEYPARRRFRLPDAGPSLVGIRHLVSWLGGGAAIEDGEAGEDYAIEYVRSLAASRGSPLLLVPPEAVPPGWADTE